MPTPEEYWAALEARVCKKCMDGDGSGSCLTAGGECAVKRFFPQILEVVSSTKSTSIVAYEQELRRRICSACMLQSEDGVCSLRDDVECALDRYFPLIVQVTEETQHRAILGP